MHLLAKEKTTNEKNCLTTVIGFILTNLHNCWYSSIKPNKPLRYKIHLLPQNRQQIYFRFRNALTSHSFAGLFTYNETTTIFLKHLFNSRSNRCLNYTALQTKFESSHSLKTDLKVSSDAGQTGRDIAIHYTDICKNGCHNTPISYLNYNSEFPNDGGLKLINGVYVPANNLPLLYKKQITMGITA
jgi:hypothetical protein